MVQNEILIIDVYYSIVHKKMQIKCLRPHLSYALFRLKYKVYKLHKRSQILIDVHEKFVLLKIRKLAKLHTLKAVSFTQFYNKECC